MSEEVIRHPFAEWVDDPLGETPAKTFGDDEPLWVFAVDPGGRQEPTSGIDTPVTTEPVLYFHTEVQSSAHDEWTVRGERFRQDGEGAVWTSPRRRRSKTVIALTRRTG